MADWETTSTILDRLGRKDPAAWEQFVERFRTPVLAFAHKLGLAPADAEDAAQETLLAFMKMFQRGAYDRSRGRLHQWLFGIAYRQIFNVRRRRGRAGRPSERAGGTTFWAHVPEEAASQIWEAEWAQAVLKRCVERARGEFSHQMFQAFHLVVREGRSADQAAEQLGMTRAAVYTAKHRVLKRVRELREQLEDVSSRF